MHRIHRVHAMAKTTDNAPPIEPLSYSPEGAARRLNCSVRRIYSHIADGTLRSYKDGKSRRIPDVELQRLVARKMAEAL